MPIETIRFSVNGSNPGQQSIQVTVDSNGNAVGSFSYDGGTTGVDIVQAFLDSKSLSSNLGQVTWQNGNGLISHTGVSALVYAASGNGIIPLTLPAPWFAQSFNSLMFNTHPSSLLAGDPHDSGNQSRPMVNNSITSVGTYSGDVAVAGNGIQAGVAGAFYNFAMVLSGMFIVTQAGLITFTAYADAAYVLGIRGATYVSGPRILGGIASTPVNHYPVLCGQNNNTQDWHISSSNPQVIHFPAPGAYPFEIVYATANHDERQFSLLANGTVIRPVAAISAPPPPPPGTGKLILSPNTSGPNLVGTVQNFTLQISGITYQTVSCLPLFEGKPGSIAISNTAGSTNYLIPALPGGVTVDPNLAASNLFALSGDNGSWQNRLAVSYSGSGALYHLNYNGAAVDPNIAITNLTVSAVDVADYNAAKRAIDLFSATSQGGGSSSQLQVRWLVNPQIASVMPTTLHGNGGSYTVSFNLAKPLPPIQNTIAAVFTGSGGLVVTNQHANYNSSGFLTGWTVTVTTPITAGQGQATLALTATGNLTYLSGTGFVTENHTYISGQATAIALTPR
jgi:hypothetical protein